MRRLVAFPDFLLPGAHAKVPAITEHCMTTYQSEHTRRAFMCAFSKMIVKKNGRLRVYACTLVDDDPDYDVGGTLAESLSRQITRLLGLEESHAWASAGRRKAIGILVVMPVASRLGSPRMNRSSCQSRCSLVELSFPRVVTWRMQLSVV